MESVKSMFMMALVVLYHSGVTASEFDIPTECEDQMFCDVKPSFYDKYQKDIHEKFLPIKKLWNLEDSNDDDDDYVLPKTHHSEKNCNYITKSLTPYLVQANGTTKVIVQTDFYKQRLKTTQCLDSYSSPVDGEQCFNELLTGTASGKCKTKSTTIILYAYNTGTERIERIPLEVPVCCFCSVEN